MQMLGYCLVALLILPSTCAPVVQSPSDSTDAAVYAAVLDSLAMPGKSIVLVDSTLVFTRRMPTLQPLQREAGVDSLMIQSFLKKGETSRTLPRTLPLQRDVYRVEEQDRPFGETGGPKERWKAFYGRYPGSAGLFHLSGIGYNQDRTRAILYVSHGCGGLCGSGRVVVLSRTGDTWRIYKEVILSVS